MHGASVGFGINCQSHIGCDFVVLFFCVFVVHRKNPCVSFYSIEEIGVILETWERCFVLDIERTPPTWTSFYMFMSSINIFNMRTRQTTIKFVISMIVLIGKRLLRVYNIFYLNDKSDLASTRARLSKTWRNNKSNVRMQSCKYKQSNVYVEQHCVVFVMPLAFWFR